MVSDVEEAGILYIWGPSHNHSNDTNTTKREDNYENLDYLAVINITDAPLDWSGNPIGSQYQLGKSGNFSEFTYLIGFFGKEGDNITEEAIIANLIYPLRDEGFKWIWVTDELDFCYLFKY